MCEMYGKVRIASSKYAKVSPHFVSPLLHQLLAIPLAACLHLEKCLSNYWIDCH